MSALINIVRELAGLFVEDGSLALAIVSLVVLATILAALMPDLPLAAGAVLLLGCLGVLVANVTRAGRR
jgi:hypothetical protein